MKLILFIFFLIAGLTSQAQEIECLIVHGKGVEQIVVGKSLLEDVQDVFGVKKIKKREIYGCGYFGENSCGKVQYIRYRKLGMDFSTLPRAKYTKIDRIVLDKKCKCETVEGIKIDESTGAEVIAAYGKPQSIAVKENNTYLYYKGITYILKKSDNIIDEAKSLEKKIAYIQLKAIVKKSKKK